MSEFLSIFRFSRSYIVVVRFRPHSARKIICLFSYMQSVPKIWSGCSFSDCIHQKEHKMYTVEFHFIIRYTLFCSFTRKHYNSRNRWDFQSYLVYSFCTLRFTSVLGTTDFICVFRPNWRHKNSDVRNYELRKTVLT